MKSDAKNLVDQLELVRLDPKKRWIRTGPLHTNKRVTLYEISIRREPLRLGRRAWHWGFMVFLKKKKQALARVESLRRMLGQAETGLGKLQAERREERSRRVRAMFDGFL